MSFKIEGGLFQLNFMDYHAVLGVPIDADFKDIRKRYIQVARCLHPDTCSAESTVDKQRANQLLSKLVNPAYEKFSHERNRIEYMVTLKEISKRLSHEAASIRLKSELSKQLKESKDIDLTYRTALEKLTQQQYTSFEQVLQLIAQISELNLVYLMRKDVSAWPISTPQPPAKSANPAPSSQQPQPPQGEEESVVETYLRRAQVLMQANNLAQARLELQDALKLAPNNSRCHSLIGMIYLKQNQSTMAKVHINKALQLNSQDPVALEGKQKLDRLNQSATGQSTDPKKVTNQSQPSAQPKSSGLFGGLFGGKKK